MKRAVGRGPDVEGPRGFFKMEWLGGGLADDDVRSSLGPVEPLSSSSSLAWSDGRCGPFLRCVWGGSARPKCGA